MNHHELENEYELTGDQNEESESAYKQMRHMLDGFCANILGASLTRQNGCFEIGGETIKIWAVLGHERESDR
jgi:hypothetical protein